MKTTKRRPLRRNPTLAQVRASVSRGASATAKHARSAYAARPNPKRAPIDHKFAGSLFSAGQRSTALAYLRGTVTKTTARELAAAKVRKAKR